MPKTKTRYVCQTCGSAQPKWMGQCPDCGEWNTLVEMVVQPEAPGRPGSAALAAGSVGPQPLPDIPADGYERIPVPIDELSRVLGGGIVPGSVVLISGDPGIGKSTLLLQLCDALTKAGGPILYVSGEESPAQIKLRAERMGIVTRDILVLAETHLESIAAHIEQSAAKLVVVDSVQSIYSDAIASGAGSVSQVRDCSAHLLRLAKASGFPLFLVGHVTKEGAIAGPRVLEHMVDTVLYLEGERFHSFRLLRSVKNRFGSTNEVGVFEMTEKGLTEVKNPSEAFLAERMPNAPGSAIAVTMEGTRPILVEVQALTSPTTFAQPRRTANGIDFNRLLLITAVLSKRAAAAGRPGRVRQRGGRPAGGRARGGPGRGRGHRLVGAQPAGGGRSGVDRRGGPQRRAAHRRPASAASQRGRQARLHTRAHPAVGGAQAGTSARRAGSAGRTHVTRGAGDGVGGGGGGGIGGVKIGGVSIAVTYHLW